VKTVSAILFSVLLAGAQTVFTADALCSAQPIKAKCACSHCDKKSSCCVKPSAPVQSPLSVPPPPNASQNQLHLLLAVMSQLVALSAPAAPQAVPQFSFASYATDVPLYARNCTFLL
jgi:hypothetical protein